MGLSPDEVLNLTLHDYQAATFHHAKANGDEDDDALSGDEFDDMLSGMATVGLH